MGVTFKIQQFAASNRVRIIRLFQIWEIGFALSVVVMVIAAFLQPQFILSLFLLSSNLGKMSAIILSITLLPGIFGRLGILPIPRATLMMFRRHLGITTYLFAAAHSLFAYWLPSLTYGFSPLGLFQVFGILALTMATPLIITSNDYSVRVLKSWWNKIHTLVYPMLIFALLHTILIRISVISVMLATVAVLEVVSFLVQYTRAHTTPRG